MSIDKGTVQYGFLYIFDPDQDQINDVFRSCQLGGGMLAGGGENSTVCVCCMCEGDHLMILQKDTLDNLRKTFVICTLQTALTQV
jgi:hypothetical protein